MKQVLITRNQLDQIIAVENGKLATRIAIDQDDFELGIWLTSYVCDLSEKVLERLFGEPTDEDLRIEEIRSQEARSRLKELLREWGEADE